MLNLFYTILTTFYECVCVCVCVRVCLSVCVYVFFTFFFFLLTHCAQYTLGCAVEEISVPV